MSLFYSFGKLDETIDVGYNRLGFLKSTQKPLPINVFSIRGSENAKKCSLMDPHYVKNTPYFQYKIE